MSVCAGDLFRAVWPRNTAKEAARCAGQSVRTAEGWLAGREPGSGTLMRMAARNDRLRAELLRALGETPHASVVPAATDLLALGGGRGPAPRQVVGETVRARPEQGWLRLGFR